MDYSRALSGKQRTQIIAATADLSLAEDILNTRGDIVAVIVPDALLPAPEKHPPSQKMIYPFSHFKQDCNAVVVMDEAAFPALMRQLEPYQRAGKVVIPAQADWVVSRALREMDAQQTAWQTTAAVNYVARCNLRGHYLEFGTFWGASFFPNYYRFRHWLQGRFFAFDSFAGLSAPHEDEAHFTAGDFTEGAYACNLSSFEAISRLVKIPDERFETVAGFYENSLTPTLSSTLGLTEKSVSVCYIDCDLKAPTEQVLEFVSPYLEDGALIYFDDWRLCRASAHVGERAAALEWLDRNTNFELIDFHRDHWQHQWFIFQRR